MEIAELMAEELGALSELFKQFWNATSSLEKMRETFSRLVEDPAYILLTAKEDDLLVGFAMGIICEELYGECRPFMVIEDVIVEKNRRRKKIGSVLMSALEQRAVEQNCCQIIFVTEADRTEAHRFYASLGYNPNWYRGFKKRLE